MLSIVVWVLDEVLYFYMVAVIVSAVLSTLSSFGVLDSRNRIVYSITDFFYRLTEPALRPIRNMMPNFGTIDLSPLVLILLLQVARMVLGRINLALLCVCLRPLVL